MNQDAGVGIEVSLCDEGKYGLAPLATAGVTAMDNFTIEK